MKQAAAAATVSEVTDLPVACVTTDYAMQVLFSEVLCYVLNDVRSEIYFHLVANALCKQSFKFRPISRS